MSLDDFLLDHTPGPTVPVAAAVLAARSALATATMDLLEIPDSTLEAMWAWRDDEADVRYGLYRAIEAIDEAAAEMARILRDNGVRRSPAADRIAPATIARWDLHGLLVGLDDAILDRHPGGNEWTPREVLGHIVSGQRAYGWFTAWWATRPLDGSVPDALPDAVRAAAVLPDEDTEAIGPTREILDRFDAILDLSAGRLGHLDDADLARPSRWAGIPVTVGFRLGRWSSHVVEHVVQLDKTLETLGHRPSEVQRLVRIIHATYGRLEALVFPGPPQDLEAADGRGRTASQVLEALATELVVDARSARSAAVAQPA
jgi:DinB superfamily